MAVRADTGSPVHSIRHGSPLPQHARAALRQTHLRPTPGPKSTTRGLLTGGATTCCPSLRARARATAAINVAAAPRRNPSLLLGWASCGSHLWLLTLL